MARYKGGRSLKTLIECPNCQQKVDIDARSVQKREEDSDLIVTCPDCRKEFILHRAKHVREKLRVATAGYTADGVKVKL
jgi:hypothetical protein